MIDILLATYNSERYLREQIESIRSQSETDWRLLIRDAASTDATVEIVRNYECLDSRIRLIGVGAADAKTNFSLLLEESSAEYIMLADHDDVWLPDKIKRSMLEMRRLEGMFGCDLPLLVHTDSQIVDEELHVLSDSLYAWGGLDPSLSAPRRMLAQSVVWGNTMLFNASLRRRGGSVPPNATMHDHWLSLVASAFGHIGFVPEATVLYRQHGSNVCGVDHRGFGRVLSRIAKGASCARNRLHMHLDQAAVFVARFGDASPNAFLRMRNWRLGGWWRRRWLLLTSGVAKQGVIRNIVMFVLI